MANREIIDIQNSAHLFVDPRAGEAGITKDGEVVCYPQIVVNNLPRSIRKNEVERYFSSNEIPLRKIKFIPQKSFCFVTCENAEQRDIAIAMIKKNKMKGTILDPVEKTDRGGDDRDNNRNSNNKRGRDDAPGGGDDKRTKGPDGLPIEADQTLSAKNAVCPLWYLPYEEQCLRKAEAMRKECLSEICTAIKKHWKDTAKYSQVKIPQWAHGVGLSYSKGLTKSSLATAEVEESSSSCSSSSAADENKNPQSYKIEVCPLVPSPEINGYRNKCEFSFGLANLPSGEKVQALGFRCSSFDKGTQIATPYDCVNIPNAKKLLVHKMLSYINRTPSADSHAPLKVYQDSTREGTYRLMTTRYSKTTLDFIVMLTVNLRTTLMADWLTEVQEIATLLKGLKRPVNVDNEDVNIMDALLTDPSSVQYTDKPLITGFVVQVFEGLSVPHSDHATVPIFGQEVITEHLLDCKFEVSSQAFFQVNTLAAEMLYQTAIDELKAPSNVSVSSSAASSTRAQSSCLLDVCCGTGTIGLCASKQLQKVSPDAASSAIRPSHVIIGVDCCASAIDSANINAGLNGVPLLDGENYLHATVASFVACKAEAVLGGLLGSYKAGSGASSIAIPGSSSIPPAVAVDPCACERTVPMSCVAANGASVPAAASTGATMAALKKLLAKSLYGKCYAVVDPPREGLHSDCCKAIRNCAAIERLVYISCNPKKSLVRDSVLLCGSNGSKVEPFRPVKAIPLDLFPHTDHCEMVLIFERATKEGLLPKAPARAAPVAAPAVEAPVSAAASEVDSTESK